MKKTFFLLMIVATLGMMSCNNNPKTEKQASLKGCDMAIFENGKVTFYNSSTNTFVPFTAEKENVISGVFSDENEFYYIITPLILRKEASGKLFPDREKPFSSGSKKPHFSGILNLTLKKTAGTDPTEKINKEIRRMLKE